MSTKRLAVLAVTALLPLGGVALAVVTTPSRVDLSQSVLGDMPLQCDSCTARHQGLGKDRSTREQERALLRDLYGASQGEN